MQQNTDNWWEEKFEVQGFVMSLKKYNHFRGGAVQTFRLKNNEIRKVP